MFPGLSFTALLEELAAPGEAPSSGSALAVALALAAATVQKAARLSAPAWPEASGVAAQAGSLGERAVKLAEDDAEAYGHALDVSADLADDDVPATLPDDEQDRRDWALGQAVAAAAEPPLALVRLAADLAELCGEAAGRVEPRVQADVVAAAALAVGVARGARELVAVNLTALPDDPRVAEADALAARAAAAAEALTRR
ncbi:MAG: methenyltetrahydrofolate cyclohydrolase [Gaiellaceae bacterium]|nr:methenyltetrahydrofolate cyclohydrolase [Gaiellaceae bacterium]